MDELKEWLLSRPYISANVLEKNCDIPSRSLNHFLTGRRKLRDEYYLKVCKELSRCGFKANGKGVEVPSLPATTKRRRAVKRVERPVIEKKVKKVPGGWKNNLRRRGNDYEKIGKWMFHSPTEGNYLVKASLPTRTIDELFDTLEDAMDFKNALLSELKPE